MHIIFRHFAERQNPLLGPPATAPCQTESRQQERGRHDFHKVPARNSIRPFTRALRKFALDPFAEFGRPCQLIQAPPIFAASLRLRTGWRNSFHWFRSAEIQLGAIQFFRCASLSTNALIVQSWRSALL